MNCTGLYTCTLSAQHLLDFTLASCEMCKQQNKTNSRYTLRCPCRVTSGLGLAQILGVLCNKILYIQKFDYLL